MPYFSVIVATVGRPSLRRTLESVFAQEWAEKDELLIVDDAYPQKASRRILSDFTAKWPDRSIRYYQLPVRWGDYGHMPRNIGIQLARNEYCVHMDDDDIFTPGVFTTIRKALESQPPVLIFKMAQNDGQKLVWKDKEIRYGNVGTPMIVHRREFAGKFLPHFGGDSDFIRSTAEKAGNKVEWREEVIAVLRPWHCHYTPEGMPVL
jgi:glycosyltransferase involved in cell wall biosynthesis